MKKELRKQRKEVLKSIEHEAQENRKAVIKAHKDMVKQLADEYEIQRRKIVLDEIGEDPTPEQFIEGSRKLQKLADYVVKQRDAMNKDRKRMLMSISKEAKRRRVTACKHFKDEDDVNNRR